MLLVGPGGQHQAVRKLDAGRPCPSQRRHEGRVPEERQRIVGLDRSAGQLERLDFGRNAGLKSGGETVRLSLSFFYSYCPPQMLNPKTPPDLERIIYRCITVPSYGLQDLKTDLEEFIGRA